MVWDATARQFGLEFVEVPVFQQQAGEQATLGVVAATKYPTAALHFARYLTARDRGELAVAKNLFQPMPDADVWEDRPEMTLMSGAMLKPAIDELIKRFKQREGVDDRHELQRLRHPRGDNEGHEGRRERARHAFPDAYFSCDVSFMKQRAAVVRGLQAVISRNDMVLAVPKGNPTGVKSIARTWRGRNCGSGWPIRSIRPWGS